MARKGQRREALFLDGDSQLLIQFADQSRLRPFARLDLAARKFPQARHRFSVGALRQQHASVGIDQRAGGDKNEFDAHGRNHLKEGMVKGCSKARAQSEVSLRWLKVGRMG